MEVSECRDGTLVSAPAPMIWFPGHYLQKISFQIFEMILKAETTIPIINNQGSTTSIQFNPG